MRDRARWPRGNGRPGNWFRRRLRPSGQAPGRGALSPEPAPAAGGFCERDDRSPWAGGAGPARHVDNENCHDCPPREQEPHMKIGPLEVIICAFPKPTIDATVIKALSETVKSGAVALADLALVSRDGQGVVHVRDLQDDLPAAWSGMIRDSRPLTLLNDADLGAGGGDDRKQRNSAGRRRRTPLGTATFRGGAALRRCDGTAGENPAGRCSHRHRSRWRHHKLNGIHRHEGTLSCHLPEAAAPGCSERFLERLLFRARHRATATAATRRAAPREQETALQNSGPGTRPRVPGPRPFRRASLPRRQAEAELADQLSRLADLRSAGLLTDDEFAAAKARLLM